MLNIITDSKEAITILEPVGALSQNDFERASKQIDPLIEKVGQLKGLIIYAESFPYWDSFSAFVKHLKFIEAHHAKVEKVAFVTNSSIVDFVEPLAKHFQFNDLDKARAWIKGEDDFLETHGLSMGLKRLDSNNFFLSFTAIGKLTHEDYERIMPIIDATLSEVKKPKINALVDIKNFQGWEAKAAWDDLKLGIKHGLAFNKIAIYGHNKLINNLMNVSSWFISGEIKEFHNRQEALRWLNEEEVAKA